MEGILTFEKRKFMLVASAVVQLIAGYRMIFIKLNAEKFAEHKLPNAIENAIVKSIGHNLLIMFL